MHRASMARAVSPLDSPGKQRSTVDRGSRRKNGRGTDALFTYATKHRIKLTIGGNRTLAAVIKVSGLGQVVTLETDG